MHFSQDYVIYCNIVCKEVLFSLGLFLINLLVTSRDNRQLYSHVFKNAIIPILTGFPAQFVSAFFTGSILIETIFSLDGIGLLSYEAIIQRDYPVVMGTLFIFTLIGLITKLITDIMYVYVDPRIKFSSSSTQRNS